jgi:cysteine desulfurase family protein
MTRDMTQQRPLIYFDNGATSFPKPERVARAISAFLTEGAVNPGRSGFDLSLETGRMVDGVRRGLTRLFNNPAGDPNRTVFTSNATDALNIALRGLCQAGDHVVSTVLEHNSVLRPLTMLQEAGLITFDLAPCDRSGRVRVEDMARLLKPATRLVVATHGSNVCGSILPVAAIGALCRDRGVTFVLGASQSAGLIPVDMQDMNIDVVAFTGHKALMGPTGTGGLVVGPGVDLTPTRWGGTGVRSAEATHPTEYPYRLEAGTLNTVGLAGLAAALTWIAEKDPGVVLAAEMALADRFLAGCAHLGAVRIHGLAEPAPTELGADRLPVLAVTIDGMEPQKVGLLLDADWDIAVRSGLQCAPLAHQALGTFPQGTVRFSFGPFNTPAHVDRSLEALAAITR